MKVLHINSSDNTGGASRACNDIHNALIKLGIDSHLLVQSGNSEDHRIHKINSSILEKLKTLVRRTLDLAFIKLLTVEKRGRFSFPFTGKNVSKLKIFKDADIVNLHWINEGFFSLNTLGNIAASGKPVVWTLHDMWAFTGGCHYSLDCRNFETVCSVCPTLKIKGQNDLSKRIFDNKSKIYKEFNFNIVTCSEWLASEVKKSKLLKEKITVVIPNTLKTEVYKPLEKSSILSKLKLNGANRYILFGTMTLKDERKGFDLFIECIKVLESSFPDLKQKVKLLVAGSGKSMKGMELPLETIYLGRLNSEHEMAEFYNAGSLFVAPSREDNLPNTVMESLSCGTPVVAFNIGGMPEMINHKVNGYLAKPLDVGDLANGIKWVLDHPDAEKLSEAARLKIEKQFNYATVAESYSNFYQTVLKG